MLTRFALVLAWPSCKTLSSDRAASIEKGPASPHTLLPGLRPALAGAQASGLRSMHDLNAGAETTELQVDIHAAAREGEANAEVIKVFAELVRVPKLQVQLTVGTRKSRSKTIIIQGLSPQQVLARLRQNCK
mmetsp:Transcript_41475/g.91119  ORF Transcript_41475/g.91119 Transcript_41475/m.91119 type:complete len:132 (-) Transcript_41475:363-758(-)